MIPPKLGRMEQVTLRDVWKTEDRDFTPWLGQEENIALLGKTIGIELEVEAQEKEVGPFRADILCRDTIDDNWVLIENQLERTNHTHLGQLLTYAAGLKAVTIVWISDQFTDEHRAALDWLNDITDDRFNFFGLEVELWKIGGSLAAPKFNVISKPNEWSRTITDAAHRAEPGSVTETKQLQQEFWIGLRDMLKQKKSFLKPQAPRPKHWLNFSLGKAFVHMSATVNTREKFIRTSVICTGEHAKAHFSLLQDMKDDIEKEIGAELDWREMPNKKQSWIVLRKPGVDPANRSDWPAQHAWMGEHLEKLHKVFSPRVRKLDASEYDPDEEEDE